MKKIVMTLVLGVVALGVGSSQAGMYVGDVFTVCDASGTQGPPAISGNIVVWGDERNGEWPLCGYDLSTGTEFTISTSQPNHSAQPPAIDGDIVVWCDFRNVVGNDNNTDIYGYNFSTNTEFPICTNAIQQSTHVAVNGNIVAWVQWRGSDDYDIYGYDLSSQTEFPISTASGYQYNPATNGNVVVWSDMKAGADDWDIYGYDLSSQTEFPICTDSSSTSEYPAISGDIVVWHDTRTRPDTGFDIYGYDLSTQTEFAICTDTAWQRFPDISDTLVVWQDNRNGDYDIFGYDFTTQTEFPIATGLGDQTRPAVSGNFVVWQSDGDIYGAEILEATTPVSLDIKPGSCPNPLNVKSKGVLPVAILGTEEFDVTTIDPASIRLVGAMPIRSGCEDVATPVAEPDICECTTDGPDGFTDLVLKFKTQDIVEVLGAVTDGEMIELQLTGVLFDETPIEGADCIIIRGSKTQPAEKGKSKKK